MEKKLKVEIPRCPNFLRVGNNYVSVMDFTDTELKSIGKQWTRDLVDNAKRKRKLNKQTGK